MVKISIITAAYNCEDTIEQTIVSVLEQDYPNVEYIIIDGKSTDNTLEIIKKYEKKGIRWISEEDEGVYYALNKGIEMATGDYFQILGSDDAIYKKDSISKIVCQLEDNVSILSAAVMLVDENTLKTCPLNNYEARDRLNYDGSMVPHQGMFVKTTLGKKYKFDTNYKIVADHKFFLQCYYDSEVNIKYIDDVVAFYANGGISSDDKKLLKEKNQLYKELGLPFYDSITNSRANWKKCIKKILCFLGVLEVITYLYAWVNKKVLWKKHHCNNKICRWCGRM